MSLYPGDSPDNPLGHLEIPAIAAASPASGPVASAVTAIKVLMDGIGSAFGASPEGRRYVGAAVLVAGLAIVGWLILRARRK